MTLTTIFAVVSTWVLFSAAIVVFLCMNASRLSQTEEWPRDRRLRKPTYRSVRHSEDAASVAATGVVKSGGQ